MPGIQLWGGWAWGRSIGVVSDAVMSLADDFEVVGRDQWMALVEQVLRGAPFDEKLVSTTYDGISIQPLYTGADHSGDTGLPGIAPFTRGGRLTGGPWQVRQAHSRATGNQAILADLRGGADAIELHLDGPASVKELDALLDGVPSTVPVMLSPGSSGAICPLVEWWEQGGMDRSEARGGFGIDAADPAAAPSVANSSHYPGVLVAVVNAAQLADRGASEAQELAGSLADAVTYLRACHQAGIEVSEAASKLEFRYGAGVDQFLTVAKLRAARRLWARVIEACGSDQVAQRQHAVTSWAMMSRRDPVVNMIRTTVACFAAAAGGADSIGVRPYDSAVGVPDPLGLRIARNTQLLLREESHLHQVIDPGGGSYYVEALTDALAQKAWALFQELEAGADLAGRIQQTSVARNRDVATRRLPLTGVSEFADPHEVPLDRPPLSDPGLSMLVDNGLNRLAEPYEALRDAADAAPERARAFLVNLGPLPTHTARSTFAANLLAAGGIRSLTSEGFDTPEQAAQAWSLAGTPVAVLCSSDEVYATQAGPTMAALKKAGCDYVVIAGRPGQRWGADDCLADAHMANDHLADDHLADAHIYLGCDALAVLRAIHERLGL